MSKKYDYFIVASPFGEFRCTNWNEAQREYGKADFPATLWGVRCDFDNESSICCIYAK